MTPTSDTHLKWNVSREQILLEEISLKNMLHSHILLSIDKPESNNTLGH